MTPSNERLRWMLMGGGLAAFFIALGWWLARRSPALPSALPALPTPRSLPTPPPHMIASFQVDTAAVEIVSPSTRVQRSILIATDQPIRVARTPDIASRPELGVPVAAGNQVFDWGVVGKDEKLFAVIAPGGSPASVAVVTRFPER